MKKLVIKGGSKLYGEVKISGAKNAALPLMASCILSDGNLTLSNLPHVSDISTMANLLVNLGVNIQLDGFDQEEGSKGRVIILNGQNINSYIASYDLVSKMRASIFILGPLLAKFGKAKISLPGGCAIGTRPVDLHIKAMEKMGAKIKLNNGYIEAKVDGRLNGCEIIFEKVSVGATENVLMAASLAKGKTIIKNAAREPEVIDLANCLKLMGAKITGEGSSEIIIEGVKKLKPARHKIIPDRIELGTYLTAIAMVGGKLKISGVQEWIMDGYRKPLEHSGLKIKKIDDNTIEASKISDDINSVDVSTEPFPGFPTDMQAQFMALMAIAKGTSIVKENIFENRFMHVLELVRMGANIEFQGNTAIVKGVKKLKGAEVMATDLRASVCLVLAGLVASGETVVNRLYHLERGYERIAEKLIKCGANIKILY